MRVEMLSTGLLDSKASGWGEFRAAWPALIAAFVGNALSGGSLCFYSIGVLAPSLHSVYGWGVGGIAGSLLAMTLATFIVSPIIGAVIDRFGVKRVAALSAVLMACGFSLFALLPLTLPLYLALWAFVALLGAGCLPVTWSRVINQHFRLKRGLALGISFVGTGLMGFFLKPALFATIERHGLNAGFWLLASLPLVTLVSTLIFIRSPKAEVTASTPPSTEPQSSELSGFTLRSALLDGRFWLLAAVVFAAALGVGGPLPNTESVLRSLGHPNGDAVSIARSIGLAIIAGRIVGGALLDRIWAPAVGAAGLFLGGIGCLAIWNSSGPSPAAGVEVFLIGLASGLETDLVAFLVVKYFGLKNYASIYGALYGLFGLGTGLGAIAFGTAFDVLHSYTAVLAVFGGVLIVCAAMILFLGPYRYQEKRRR